MFDSKVKNKTQINKYYQQYYKNYAIFVVMSTYSNGKKPNEFKEGEKVVLAVLIIILIIWLRISL
tara:strand:+ start:729 stop:923 length:195 start_codon:yes stop_codon:yes gene_type:complete